VHLAGFYYKHMKRVKLVIIFWGQLIKASAVHQLSC